MTPVFFKDQAALRDWFDLNHQKEKELFVGYYTVKSGKPSVTWSQSVDEAICFGWIDGIRRSIDQDSYCIRFTPRRPGSNWSKVNINKAEELTKQGLMLPMGIEAYSIRKEEKSGVYTYENESTQLNPDLEKLFINKGKAWEYFQSRPPYYRKITIRWIMSAKQESTRRKRLDELITACEAEEKIKAMRSGEKK